MSTQPVLTRESFLKLSTEELKKIVHDPAKLAEANALLDGSVVPEPVAEVVPDTATVLTPEEIVAQQAETDRLAAEAAAKAETDRLAAEAAAKAEADALEEEYKAAGVTVSKDGNGNITKIVMDYQARDDAGNPIGRETHLVAKSWFDLTRQQKSAHENAMRFAERIKKQKLTVKRDDPNEPKALTDTELVQLQEDLKGEDRDKASKAAQQIRDNDAQNAVKAAVEAKASFEFLTAHIEDYNRCEANNKMLSEYIRGNNLEWTKDNLEIAFTALESQLAQKEQPVPPAPINPAPVAPAPVVPPPATVATPAPQVTPQLPAPPAPRPGVNAGLVPGAQSAPRPTNQPKGLTKDDITKMPREEFKRRMKDPKFVAEVNALRITNGLSQRTLG